jgi:uncharacterized protein YaiI (UPF0178 family)
VTAIIYLDADACPVKEQVYRVAARYGIPVSVVANAHLRLPQLAGLNAKVVVVANTPDAADDWNVERAKPGDLVLTADIPLAARVIPNGVSCYDFRGGEFHPNGIGEALAARDLNAQLRSMGLVTGGPPAFSPRDRSNFASRLDTVVGRMARAEANAKPAE